MGRAGATLPWGAWAVLRGGNGCRQGRVGWAAVDGLGLVGLGWADRAGLGGLRLGRLVCAG